MKGELLINPSSFTKMNNEQHDSIDGNDTSRQVTILCIHFVCVLILFFLGAILQGLLIAAAGFPSAAITYLTSWSFVPLNIIFAGVPIYIYLSHGYINPKANTIIGTDNPLSRSQFQDGGTQFIVYQSGIALKYAWERVEANEVDIENQQALGSESLAITLQNGIALHFEIKGMWRVYLPFLSAFIQNANKKEVTLTQLKSLMNQTLEQICCIYRDSNQVRSNLSVIVKQLFESVRPQYLEYGIELTELNFSKCDYSEETQKELDKLVELQAVSRIAENMGDPEKFRLAAAAAGKSGVKVTKDIREIVMSPETAKAVKEMGIGGAIATGLHETTK